jgi:hypothetical protein
MAEEQKVLRVVSWNVNGLYSTLKDAASRYQSASYYFSDVLHADIVCFQVCDFLPSSYSFHSFFLWYAFGLVRIGLDWIGLFWFGSVRFCFFGFFFSFPRSVLLGAISRHCVRLL